ncbi:hypothetical protein L6452_18351 [Arctium lappa]|uniref:Uncharacterized protein n=1 Tax=Arctium lappa TaxID=4217 RepID=A0ACB9C633_ARCLA|nr:hypothetical protein L6452_18351 [Arctium lappa]
MKLVLKKKKSKFVLKKSRTDHDSFKKGETKEDESQFEGEMGKEAEMGTKAESSKAAETEVAAVTEAEAVTEVAVETEKAAAETGLTVEEIEIAETLVKAKTDTPKATQKVKGVEIKEGGFEKKRKEIIDAKVKRKGKEKVVEPLKKTKKSVQIALDGEVAKQLQAEIEAEEESQTAKDRQIALDLSEKLNEEYQRSLRAAAEAKKVQEKTSMPRQPTQTKKRQPSKTFIANQERRKMINFLKGSVGVKEGMFTGMSYGRIEELYKKEITKLQGDFTQRVEVERKMKERHDLHIQQPFPESEETTSTKEVEEEQKEETLAQTVKAVKRMKTIASKKQTKRPRIEEVQKEVKPVVTTPEE